MTKKNGAQPLVETFRDRRALVRWTAERIVRLCAAAIEEKGRFVVALSGGSTPRPLYALLAGELAGSIDWSRVHLFWGDERCVPPDDPQSNYRMVKESLLSGVSVPLSHIHRIHGEDDPKAAAAGYEKELRSFFGSAGGDGPPRTGFDLVLLGMGENGHTASLFPGLPAVTETVRWVMAQYVEVVSMWRITLTPVVINAAERIFFLVQGGEKAETAARVLGGPINPEVLPAQTIRPVHGQLLWLMDEAAAASVRKESSLPDASGKRTAHVRRK
jgi:6-phosphogluconolactonase